MGEILPLAEAEAEADALDRAAVEGITHPARRAERLSWRILLRRHTQHPVEVEYAKNGAPRIRNFPYPHISVSHCRDRVAVVMSSRPCAVDIEQTDRNFAKVAARFITEQESRIAPTAIEKAAIWSGKECLYKLYGREGLDLLRDIHITDIDLACGRIQGEVLTEPAVTMRVERPDETHIVVYHI